MKLAQSLTLFLSAILCSSISLANDQNQASDTHTQAIVTILDAIDTTNITRRAMMQSFAQDTSEYMTEEFVSCVNNNLTDDMLYDLFIPVYRSNLDENSALRLADFFNTETGKKFGVIVRIQTGETLPMPNMTTEDMQIYTQYENDVLKLGSQQLVSDAEAAGMDLGMQLGLDCASVLK